MVHGWTPLLYLMKNLDIDMTPRANTDWKVHNSSTLQIGEQTYDEPRQGFDFDVTSSDNRRKIYAFID